MTRRFGSDSFVPLFKSMQCTQTVMNATNALQKTDEDAAEYLDEILSNAFAFISWIQDGMK